MRRKKNRKFPSSKNFLFIVRARRPIVPLISERICNTNQTASTSATKPSSLKRLQAKRAQPQLPNHHSKPCDRERLNPNPPPPHEISAITICSTPSPTTRGPVPKATGVNPVVISIWSWGHWCSVVLLLIVFELGSFRCEFGLISIAELLLQLL